MTPKTHALLERTFARFRPSPALRLSEWAEQKIILPAGQSARPGRYRNWPYFAAVLDSIGDLTVERVTLMKSARVGFTKGMIIAIAALAENNPAAMALLVPTDDDARRMAVDEVEPVLQASAQGLTATLREGRLVGRNTVKRKLFAGGASLKILSARAPRNLASHDIKYLFCDEIDRFELTTEGDPLEVAIRRTMAHPDRKIIIGSTPTEEGISTVERSYGESDQRVYEIPCHHCGHFFELLWQHIHWPKGSPELAAAHCPDCGQELDERRKRQMIEGGRWRVCRPGVVGHHGFRINALVSLLAKAQWPILAAEYEQAERAGPAAMQPFTNLVLGQTWRTSINALSMEGLAGRVECFGLEQGIPPWVTMITAGCDVQDDRIEVTLLGWPVFGAPSALGHVVVPGNTLEVATWQSLDKFLLSKWEHPNGWNLGIDGTAVDSGGSKGRTQRVYDFCASRFVRRVFAVKGASGPREMWKRAMRVKTNLPLFIIGHDQAKTAVMESMAQDPISKDGTPNPQSMRFSDELPLTWFEQATGEVRRVKYLKNRAIIEFVPKRPGQRVEALDCLCYAWAVRFSPEVRSIDLRARAARRVVRQTSAAATPIPEAPKRGGGWASVFNG